MKNSTIIQTVVTITLFSVLPIMAARTSELKFTKETEFPNLGLSIKLMPDARAVPIPPASVYTYTRTSSTGSTQKMEKYDPWELWLATQNGGQWADEFGNLLAFAKITCPAPPSGTPKHVTREEFKEVQAASLPTSQQWNDADIRNWVKAFTRSSQVQSEKMTIKSFKIQDVIRFYMDSDTSQTAYAFKLNKSAAGQSRAPDCYYFFHIKLTNDADPNKATASIHSSFLTTIQGSKEQGTGTRTASTRFQTARTSPIQAMTGNDNHSPEFIESRNRVANSIKNFKDWWFVNTENYIILSNLSIRHKIMIKDIQTEIEYLRKAYEKLVPPQKEITAVSVLRVFATPEAYKAYVGPNYAWSGGLWMPSKKEMVIRPIDWGKNKEQRDVVKQVTAHEAFHQYIFYALDQSQVSVWFNEGHAELYSISEIKNNKLELNEDERRVNTLLQMIEGNRADTQALLNMSYADFYTKNDQKRSENYILAWAIVYYLRKGAMLDQPASHANVCDKYLEVLWESRDPQKATMAAFGPTNQYNFQKDFVDFWTSKSKRSAARRNNIF